MKASEWDWKNDGVMPNCSERIGSRVSEADIVMRFDFHYTGGDFAILRRNTAGLPGPQDQFVKVVLDQENIVTHDFGTVPQCPKEDGDVSSDVLISYCITRVNPRFSDHHHIDKFLLNCSIENTHDTLRYMNPLDPRLKRFIVAHLGTWFAEGFVYVKNLEQEQSALQELAELMKQHEYIRKECILRYI